MSEEVVGNHVYIDGDYAHPVWKCAECGRFLRNQSHADGCSRPPEPDEVDLMTQEVSHRR